MRHEKPGPGDSAGPSSSSPLLVGKRGLELIADPLLNKGTAFPVAERDALGLRGLVPPAVSTIELQLARVKENFERVGPPLDRFLYLAALQDRNETLFFRFVLEHLEKVLPFVYTPTVGEACQRYSRIYRRARGLYITPGDAGRVDEALENLGERDVRVIVVTDGERILGLGDQGVGGMGIPVGKLALYTAGAGIHPAACLPVCFDPGTENAELLSDPLYLGVRRPRLRGEAYDALVDELVSAALRRWPEVLIQWEDFATANAFRLLERYRGRILTFNDDIQGTGAVALAGILVAVRARGERVSDQQAVFLGAGEAAYGIASQVVAEMATEGTPEEDARRRIWMLDRGGLVTRGRADLPPHAARFAREEGEAAKLGLGGAPAGPSLLDVVRRVRPTVLVGVSGQPGAFGEEVVRAMAEACPAPLILPLSNPTSKAECAPASIYAWTGGRALVATGSPFAPVEHAGRRHRPGQANNAFIFPGVGLGVLVARARRVTDAMFLAAARALADLVGPADLAEGALYPTVSRLREASRAVATAVAREAVRSGEARAPIGEAEVPERVAAAMWFPEYRPYAPAV